MVLTKTLADFLRDSQVILLYRQFVKTAYRAPDATAREELLAQVRREFRTTSRDNLPYKLSKGRETLKMLQASYSMTSEDTFALTQVALKRSNSSATRTSLPRLPVIPRKAAPEKSPLRLTTLGSSQVAETSRFGRSQSTSRFTAAARSLLDSLAQEVQRDVAQMSARPVELLVHMQKLEKTQAVQEQLAQLQTQVLARKREYNKCLSERKSREGILARLKDEMVKLALLGKGGENPKETYESLQARLESAQADVESEEHYSKVLAQMHDVRAKSVLALNKPIVHLRTQLSQLKTQQQEADRHATSWSQTAKALEDERTKFLCAASQQQAKRKQQMAETLAVARQRIEFEACSDCYRGFSEAILKVEDNTRSVAQMEREQKQAQAIEVVAEELQNQEAYIARQEVNLSKLRTVAFVAKEEIADYYAYLKDTEEGLNRLSEQMMGQLADGHEEIERLTRQLAVVSARDDTPPTASSIDLEQLLHSKLVRVEDAGAKMRQKESLLIEVCDVLNRILRKLPADPSESPTAKSFNALQTLSQIEAGLTAALLHSQ